MSIRARLLTGMVVLVAVGLGVAGVATYEEQRSFLLDRVDQQVQSALIPVAFQLRLSPRRTTGGGAGTRGERPFPTGGGLLGGRTLSLMAKRPDLVT